MSQTTPSMIPVSPQRIAEVHQLVNGSITTESLPLNEPFKRVAVGVDHDRLRIQSAEPHVVLGDESARRRYDSMGDGRQIHHVPVELLPEEVREQLGPQAILQA